MDNVRHLYTVLAIVGFVSLPIILNGEKLLPSDVLHLRSAEPFDVDKIFPVSRRTPHASGSTSSGRLVPAVDDAIPQRWIEDPLNLACKRLPAQRGGAQGIAVESCLIV